MPFSHSIEQARAERIGVAAATFADALRRTGEAPAGLRGKVLAQRYLAGG
jgi:hypothetical protein